MASTKQIGKNNGGAYEQSFGNMADRTVYQDAYGLKGLKIDKRNDMSTAFNVGLKAHGTTSGGAGTAGYALIPVYVDPRIIDQSRKYTPLVEIVPRVTNRGMYADYNVITAKGGATTAAESGALTATDTTYDRKSSQIKFLYAVGEVTGPSIAAQPSYILDGMTSSGTFGGFGSQNGSNALQQEVLVKAREIKELEENLIINGDASTTATQFDGIIELMGATNTVDKNTSALALADINTAIQHAFDNGGRPNLAVCSSSVYSDLLNLLAAKAGYFKSEKEVFWGYTTIVLRTMVGDVPVIPSMFMSNTTAEKAIYFLDMTVVEMRVLQDMTFEKFGKTVDADKFMLKVYETFLIKNPSFCASITEISA